MRQTTMKVAFIIIIIIIKLQHTKISINLVCVHRLKIGRKKERWRRNLTRMKSDITIWFV